MGKVLVTGASGFIGSHLVRHLVARGDDVTCLVRPASRVSDLQALGLELRYGDVRDRASLDAAVAGVDVVYHLAGVVTAFRAQDLSDVNTDGPRRMAEACARRESPPTLVFVSSLAAAGPSQADRPRLESDPPAPVSNYGRSKRAGEIALAEQAERLPITVVRPPIVFGEADPLMRTLFRSIWKFGIHVAMGVAPSRYSLVHVDDLTAALVLAAERGNRLASPARQNGSAALNPQGFYFVADDQQPTFAELGQLIGRSMGRQRVWVLGSGRTLILWPSAAVAEAISRVRRQPHIFNFDKVREARAGHWTCSAEKIQRELGFRTQAPLIHRLRETSDWYIQHNWI